MGRILALVVVLMSPGMALAQARAGDEVVAASITGSVVRMLVSLGVVLSLLVASAWAVRRWRERQSAGSESIEIVSGLSLGAKERIVLLRVGGEQILVGVSPAGMRSLHVIRDHERTFDLSIGGAE